MIIIPENKIVILFDGVCNMCISSVKFIIKRDSKDVFRFVSIQSDIGQLLIKQNNIDVNKNDSIILIDDKKIKYRSNAVLTLLWYLNTFWKVLVIFYPLPSFLRDILYKFIAKRRYIFFGRKNKCMIPDKKYEFKFLNL